MEVEAVQVPETVSPLTSEQITELRIAVNPWQHCEDLGLSLYLLTRAFVNACI